jgi:hypothetical protein
MNRIHQQWGPAIQEACKYSSVPPEFLAALIAGESGGNPDAMRFEPGVYRHLCAVQEGRQARYGELTPEILRSTQDDRVREWATSWGLTQVMGYHVARRPGGVEILKSPASHLKFALGLLGGFVEHFQLNPKLEFEEMFRCWNTGGPYGKTFDPKYVEKGLARMKVYQEMKPCSSQS